MVRNTTKERKDFNTLELEADGAAAALLADAAGFSCGAGLAEELALMGTTLAVSLFAWLRGALPVGLVGTMTLGGC